MYLHPGGERLIVTSAGMDGTRSYEKAEHHLNPEVHALLDLYKIGAIRRLDFEDRWGIVIRPRGRPRSQPAQPRDAGALEYVTLHDFYRRWMRFVHKIVGIENTLNGNLSVRRSPLVRSKSGAMSKLMARTLLDAHTILHETGLRDALGADLDALWSVTVGFCSRETSITALARALQAGRSSERARSARTLVQRVAERIEGIAPEHEHDLEGWARIEEDLRVLERCDRALMTAIKGALREGLLAFEAHEARVVEAGSEALVGALSAIPAALERHQDALREGLSGVKARVAVARAPVAPS